MEKAKEIIERDRKRLKEFYNVTPEQICEAIIDAAKTIQNDHLSQGYKVNTYILEKLLSITEDDLQIREYSGRVCRESVKFYGDLYCRRSRDSDMSNLKSFHWEFTAPIVFLYSDNFQACEHLVSIIPSELKREYDIPSSYEVFYVPANKETLPYFEQQLKWHNGCALDHATKYAKILSENELKKYGATYVRYETHSTELLKSDNLFEINCGSINITVPITKKHQQSIEFARLIHESNGYRVEVAIDTLKKWLRGAKVGFMEKMLKKIFRKNSNPVS